MKKRTEFKHLTEHDRDRIQALYIWGHNQKEIAKVLEVSPGTISRELQRYGKKTWRYSAKRAEENAREKREQSKRPGMKIEALPELRAHIIRGLKRLRSPDEIAGRLKKNGITPRVGKNAIYEWLYSEYGEPYCKYLCTERTKKRSPRRLGKKVLIPDRIPLRLRPDEPNMIHAEGDMFVSPTRLGVRDCGLLVVVPETHLLNGSIVPNKTIEIIVPAMQHITHTLPLDTCTLDNGIENVHHKEFGVDAYFCDKASPWQKPHVESSIGLIRRWFLPKGTDLSRVPNDVFQSQLHLLNHKYRRSLGYRSSYEASLERGIIKRVPRVSLTKAIAFR
jgi:transposase, IS30 family